MANKPSAEEQKEVQTRILNFDRELQEIQKKYQLKLIAQVLLPVDQRNPLGPVAVLSVPRALRGRAAGATACGRRGGN